MSGDLLEDDDDPWATSGPYTSAHHETIDHNVSVDTSLYTRKPDQASRGANVNPWAGLETFEDQNPWTTPATAPLPAIGKAVASTDNDNDWGNFEGSNTIFATTVNAGLGSGTHGQIVSNQSTVRNLDPWGGFDDFQTPEVAPPSSPAKSELPGQAAPADHAQHLQPPNSVTVQRQTPKASITPPSRPRSARDENVLFDADDLSADEDEDDFGAFENVLAETMPAENGVPTTIPPVTDQDHQDAPMSLLDLDLSDEALLRTQATTAATRESDEYDPFGLLAPDVLSVPPQNGLSTAVLEPERRTEHLGEPPVSTTENDFVSHKPMAQTEDNKNDTWEDWTERDGDTEPSLPRSVTVPQSLLKLPILLPTDGAKAGNSTNIPPPALLLALFSPIFEILDSSLIRPLAGLAQEVRHVTLNSTETRQVLKSYLSIATVLARILAGRKLRWKRDTILAQSMRIGQAGGKATGMKLATIDKTENVREDREASNVVRLWRLQLGKLRSVHTAAGISTSIPEIAETVPVRMAQVSEGAISAPKPCTLCGLKRNERISKVDISVQDTFGEWWVEHWGHRACNDFWRTEEVKLRSRPP